MFVILQCDKPKGLWMAVYLGLPQLKKTYYTPLQPDSTWTSVSLQLEGVAKEDE